MPTIKDLSDATQMQIELMKWETQYASFIMGTDHDLTDEEFETAKDLLERNPAYVANAYEYFPETIRHATSKKQILMAWVHGECDDRANAIRLFDEAMASNISIANARKRARASNAKPQRAPRNGNRHATSDELNKARQALLHLQYRTHSANGGCDGCLLVNEQVKLALNDERRAESEAGK